MWYYNQIRAPYQVYLHLQVPVLLKAKVFTWRPSTTHHLLSSNGTLGSCADDGAVTVLTPHLGRAISPGGCHKKSQ
jgi:hypothetical protein